MSMEDIVFSDSKRNKFSSKLKRFFKINRVPNLGVPSLILSTVILTSTGVYRFDILKGQFDDTEDKSKYCASYYESSSDLDLNSPLNLMGNFAFEISNKCGIYK